jgi:hypothetical protein
MKNTCWRKKEKKDGTKATRWRGQPDIANFLENFTVPFLVWQLIYDAYHQPLPWGERSHFADGIIEYYAELLGINKRKPILDSMKPLARKNIPKGHEPCPCGSGERLRNCHRQLLYSTRKKVDWKYVVKDLQTVASDQKVKSANHRV